MSCRQGFALSVEAASQPGSDLDARPGACPSYRIRHGNKPGDFLDFTEEDLDDLAENNPDEYARAVWANGGAVLHTSGRRGNCPKMPESMVS